MTADVLVAGAGPAGLAAALAAADAGCDVLLVDRACSVGGQIYREPAVGATAPVGGSLPERFRRLARHPRVRLRLGATIWQARPRDGGLRFWLQGGEGGGVVDTRAAVVATGATELVLPFPGWELPGVMTAGAAQALSKAQAVLPGRRVLVAGTGPFLLPVAAQLAMAGARVVVAEAARPARHPLLAARLAAHPGKVREAAAYAAALARHRVRFVFGRAVAACSGSGHVERVTLEPTGGRPGRALSLAVDAVCAGHGFVPALELARALGCADRPHPSLPLSTVFHDRDQATTVPGVFAAGEVTGIGGAVVAELEGAVAGAAAARFLGRPVAPAPANVHARLARARRFATLLEALYPLDGGWVERLTGATVVCRCEDTTWRQVREAAAAGSGDLRAVKGVTRCGMGYCQGRTCGPALQLAVSALTGRDLGAVGDFHSRTIMSPVPLGTIADGEEG